MYLSAIFELILLLKKKESFQNFFFFRFIRPEDVPVQYGGLSRPSDLQNGPPKPASEFTVKGGEKVNIQIEGIEVQFLSSVLTFKTLEMMSKIGILCTYGKKTT